MCPNALGLCSVSKVKGSKDMGIDIAALDTAGRDELLEHWRSLIKAAAQAYQPQPADPDNSF